MKNPYLKKSQTNSHSTSTSTSQQRQRQRQSEKQKHGQSQHRTQTQTRPSGHGHGHVQEHSDSDRDRDSINMNNNQRRERDLNQDHHSTGNRNTSSPSSPSSPSTPPSDSSSLSSSFKYHLLNIDEFKKALKEYLHSKNGNANGNGHDNTTMNLNVSFSIASHNMRQRKLLRKVIFELKQLISVLMSTSTSTSTSTSISMNRQYGNDNDKCAYDQQVRFSSYFIRSCSLHDLNFGMCMNNDNDNVNDDDNNNMNEEEQTAEDEMSELMLQVMDSVNVTIMEEYYEHLELMREHEHGHGHGHGHGFDNLANLNVTNININDTINLNTTVNMSTLGNHNNKNNNNDDEVDSPIFISEDLMTALEFLDVVYSCLDPSIILSSLQSPVDVDVDVDVNLGGNGEDNSHFGASQNCSTVMDALLHFTLLQSNKSSSNSNSNSNNKSKGNNGHRNADLKSSWDKLQTTSLSIITKGILCAEYIQSYCTSLTILPTMGSSGNGNGSGDALDSLLGRGMGIGLDDTNRAGQLTKVVERILNALTLNATNQERDASRNTNRRDSNNSMSQSQDSFQSSKSVKAIAQIDACCFHLSCMGLLSALYRSKWLHQHPFQFYCGADEGEQPYGTDLDGENTGVSPAISLLMDQLYNNAQGVWDCLTRLDGKDDIALKGPSTSEVASFATATMAFSLFMQIQSCGNPNRKADDKSLAIDNNKVEQLFSTTFVNGRSLCRSNKILSYHNNIFVEGAMEVIILLCSCRHDSLRRFVKGGSFRTILSRAFYENLLCSDGDGGKHIINPTQQNFTRGLLLTSIHLNEAEGTGFRKMILQTLNQGDESSTVSSNNARLLSTMFQRANCMSLTAPILLFMKCLLVQSTLNGQWQMRDELASMTWNSIMTNDACRKIRALTAGVLSRYNRRGGSNYVHGLLDTLEFLFSDVQFQTNCIHHVLGDNIISLSVKILKSSSSKEPSEDAIMLRPLICALQLGAASLLSRKCLHDKRGNSTAIKGLLTRFAANSLQYNGSNSRYAVAEIGIEYALTQSISRDLTRRVLNFLSILNFIRNEDSFDEASILFEDAVANKTRVSFLENRSVKAQVQINAMESQCKSLRHEKEILSHKIATSNSMFQRELRQKLSIARSDALDMVQTQVDEKRELSYQTTKLEEKLLHERQKLDKVQSDAKIERTASKNIHADLNSCIEDLTAQLDSNKLRLKKSEDDVQKKDTRLAEATSAIKDTNHKLSSVIDMFNNAEKENKLLKEKLEKSFIELISMAQIYSSKEKEHTGECESLMNKQHEIEHSIEGEIARRRRAEDKYSQLKEKFIEAKKKHENELERVEEEKRRDEMRRRERDKERHQNEMKRREDEKRKEERRQRHDEEKAASRRQDGRRPMGTLDFMNSIHDTSMRSERNASSFSRSIRDNEEPRKARKKSSRNGSQKSGFRIVR